MTRYEGKKYDDDSESPGTHAGLLNHLKKLKWKSAQKVIVEPLSYVQQA
jgi:hypothetical protein